MKRAAIYARVSTDEQASKGYSLESQIELCEQYARRAGMEIVEVFRDDISGTIPMDARPGGAALQAAIDQKRINAVVSWRVDRLYRDLVDLLLTVRLWLRSNVEIYPLDIGKIETQNDILLVIRGWQSDDERVKIIERTTRGRNTKAKNGRAVGAGVPPFGYDYSNGAFTVNEDEAEIVRMIFRWYLEGEENGKPLGQIEIAHLLTEYGLPTPSQYKDRKISTRSKTGVWNGGTISRILGSETYTGVLHWGKNIGNRGRGGKRAKEDQIAIAVPAIIDQETFELAKAQREKNNHRAHRTSWRFYLLSGRIRCSCGYRMVGSNGNYYCQRRYWKSQGDPCPQKPINGKWIEEWAWDKIVQLATNPDFFRHYLEGIRDAELTQIEPKTIELDVIEKSLDEVEVEAGDIGGALVYAKGVVLADLCKRQDRLNERHERLKSKQAQLKTELSQQVMTDEAIVTLIEAQARVMAGFREMTPDEKKEFLNMLDAQVIIENDSPKLAIGRFPLEVTQDGIDTKPNLKKFEDQTPDGVRKSGPKL